MGGEKGKPPNIPKTIPMEVGGKSETDPPLQQEEAGAVASYGGSDAPLPHKTVTWEEQVQIMEVNLQRRQLKENCLHPILRGVQP